MSEGSSKDRLKQFLPSEAEIDRALESALADEARHGGIPESGPALQVVRQNQEVNGTVLTANQDGVVVDISYKSEGYVPANEFGDELPKVGEALKAVVLQMENAEGMVQLSVQEAQRKKIWDSVGEQTGATVRGEVTEAVKGGLIVDIGVRAFMPAKFADVRYVEDLESFVGKSFDVRVIEANAQTRKVTVSRRALLQESRDAQKAKLFETLAEGQTVKGTVTNITSFGAFVDIGGTEGLIHKGDLAWGRVENVSDVVKLGDEVTAVVVSFDRSADKIGLGLKQAGPSPWDDVPARFGAGRRATGKVVGLLDFGAIVELEQGIQGLVHVSEMRWGRRVNRPQEVVQLGQEVDVEVLSLDMDKKKISLSMKKVEENPWSNLSQKYPFATIVHGTVTELADFGAFVKLPDGVEGMVHISELSWTERLRHPSEMLKVGDEVTAIVVGADEERQRLALSIRKTEPDPWWDVAERFPKGKSVEGVVTRIKEFGAFVEIDKGLEGLVHISNLGEGRVNRPQDVVHQDDRVTVEVLEVDEEAHRLGLKLLSNHSRATEDEG